MIREVVEILKCPICGENLALSERKTEKEEVIEGTLECLNNHKWQIREGVLDFCSQEQTFGNNWSECYKGISSEEMDRKLWEATPKNQRELRNKAKEFIIDKINNENVKTVLDIATGRGMLLTELVKKVENNVHIICADLSFEVLMRDRLKVKKINPNAKVSYIACDATNLPFKNNSIDMAVSFFGIINMMDKILEGIKDAKRVLKKNCKLLNLGTIVEKETKRYNEVQVLLKSENMEVDLEVFTRDGFRLIHEKCFEEVEIVTVGESIAEKNECDLIPFEGEWFAKEIAIGIKH